MHDKWKTFSFFFLATQHYKNSTSTNVTGLCLCEQKSQIGALREITLMRKGRNWNCVERLGGSDCLIGESLWEGLMRDECIRTAEAGRVRQSAKNFACVWVYFGVVGLKGNKNVSQDGAPCGIWNFFQIETRDGVLLKCKHARRNVLCIL